MSIVTPILAVRENPVKETATILGGNSFNFDITALSDYKVKDYTITFNSDAQNKNRFVKSVCVNKSGLVKRIVYAKGGDSIDVDVDIVQGVTNIELKITNNESYSLLVCVTRLIV